MNLQVTKYGCVAFGQVIHLSNGSYSLENALVFLSDQKLQTHLQRDVTF